VSQNSINVALALGVALLHGSTPGQIILRRLGVNAVEVIHSITQK